MDDNYGIMCLLKQSVFFVDQVDYLNLLEKIQKAFKIAWTHC